MKHIVWAIAKPLLIDMLFVWALKLAMKAIDGFDKWMLAKVQSTDAKYDDTLYETFKENRKAIEVAVEKILKNIKGNK